MDCGVYTLPQYWTHAAFLYYQITYPVQSAPAAPLEVRILYSERDLLENNLANCVTYLQVLRKKQERNERRLSTDPSTPRRKRKQLQQSNRELKREILIREQEQSTLLNNLQACKAKLYVAETLSSPYTGLLSSVAAFTSGSTRCTVPEESEPTEISWNGWTDDAVMSPFTKRSHNPFFVTEIAPKERVENSIEEAVPVDTDPHVPLTTIVEGLGIAVPFASSEAASPQALLSILSPKAEVFEPRTISCLQGYGSAEQRVEQPSVSKALVLRHLLDEAQRADSCYQPTSPQLQPSSRFARNYTWCNNTPQASAAKDGQGNHLNRRKRTNSM